MAGPVIDTTKAVNLLTNQAGDLMDYINKPIGGGQAPNGPLKPLIAVPTTAGTGSESTAMCVLDILSMKVKTGISHWRLRPTLAVIDPLLTMSLPAEVSAASGMDIVCHALESYTARHCTAFAAKQPEQRVTYCGSNPVSDLWCEGAMALLATSFRRAVHDGANDVAARSDMMLAATFAGSRAWDSATAASISRTRTPTRSPGWSRTTGRPATRRTSRWCPTASRCRSPRPRLSGSASPARRSATCGPRPCWPQEKLSDPAEQLPQVSH